MTVFERSPSSSDEKSIPARRPMGLMPTTLLMTVPSMDAAPAKSPRRQRAMAPMSFPTRPVISPSALTASEIKFPIDDQKDFCLALASLPVFSSIFPKSLEIALNRSVTPWKRSVKPLSHVSKTPSQSNPLMKFLVMKSRPLAILSSSSVTLSVKFESVSPSRNRSSFSHMGARVFEEFHPFM